MAYSLLAVPTIYVKLIQALEAAKQVDREGHRGRFQKMRLMVSGSAARQRACISSGRLTGRELLERYGMTEIGMAVSGSTAVNAGLAVGAAAGASKCV